MEHLNCQAYIKGETLCVGFSETPLMFSEMQYPVGDGATDFSMLPENLVRRVFGTFRTEFLHSIEKQDTTDEFSSLLVDYTKAFSNMNAYFNFYMEIYAAFLVCLRIKEQNIKKLFTNFLLKNADGVDIESVDFTDADEASLWGAYAFIDDIKIRQARLKEDYEAISSSAGDLESLTQMQRLYILSRQDRNYLTCEFKTRLQPNYSDIPNMEDIVQIKTTLLENKVDIVEMVEIQNLDDLLSYEMYHTLKSNLLIRKCKYCGEFFIVRGRIDTEYCDRVKEGEVKPCSIIGATRSYWGSKMEDPVHIEFQKAYKRNHSRQRVGKMTQNEFYEWSEEARMKRGECEAGALLLAEFKEWLGNKL